MLPESGSVALCGKTAAWFVFTVATCSILPALPGAAVQAATPQQIDEAISRGVAYIYTQQKPGGHWEIDDRRIGDAHEWETMQGDSFGGFSALCTYALLAGGESPQDKRVAAAIDFLKRADVVGIYSLGLRAQVWRLLADNPKNQAELRQYINADAERILATLNTDGASRGLWDYGNGKGERMDHSVSQYGILGLWALQDAGAKIDRRYWTVFDQVWREGQFPDGGWAYDSSPAHTGDQPNPTASMTAAGIATLFITQDNADTDSGERHGNIFNANIENGLRWMTKHFEEVWTNYAWYGVERIGVASGTKYFGTTDWFQAGADKLIAAQRTDGSWGAQGPGTDLTNSCFAILFLARGRAPIMMNKVHYELVDKAGKPAEVTDWNERPRDAANLAKWTGEQIESGLNWQLVNLKVAAEDLRDAPILYLSGDQELHLSDADEQKLKTFVTEGGMIVGNADFNSKPFGESFEALGTRLFGYAFRPLEPNSPIWNEQAHLRAGRLKVAALSNGIRELMLLLDGADLGKVWQSAPEGRPEAYELGANIFLYAVDRKNLVSRGQTNVVIANPAIINNRTIRIARLKYDGNWDPEPGGWPRLAAIFHNDFHADLDVQTIDLGSGQLNAVPDAAGPPSASAAEIRKQAFRRIPPEQVLATEGDQQKLDALLQPQIAQIHAELAAAEQARLAKLARFKVADLTGTATFHLTDPQTAELQAFLKSGGTLVIDAGGGSPEFSQSAQSLLQRLYPDSAEKALAIPLPPDNPIYALPQARIDAIKYRTFAHSMLGNLRFGRVCGISDGGRTAVYFSKEDLSAGLVGQPTDGIIGYTPDVATAIMRNMILVSNPAPAPLPVPSSAPVPAPVH